MDWQIAEDNGRIYYYNAVTNETSWDPPPECWEPLFTDDGVPYFHNILTRETCWEIEGTELSSTEAVDKEEKKGNKESTENEATPQVEKDIIADETLRKLCRNYVLECKQIELAGKASCKVSVSCSCCCSSSVGAFLLPNALSCCFLRYARAILSVRSF